MAEDIDFAKEYQIKAISDQKNIFANYLPNSMLTVLKLFI